MAADNNHNNNPRHRVRNSKSSSDLASCLKVWQENQRRRKTTEDENELEDEEAEHFERIMATFVHYKARCLRQLQKQLIFYNRLTPRHKSMLRNAENGADFYVEHLKRVKICVDENQQFLNLIISRVGRMFENQNYDKDSRASGTAIKRKKWTDERSVSEFNMEKLRSTLKQFVRDWADEGKEERETCYRPLLDDLKRLFPDPKGVEVLVPGAGLGRLAWDIAKAGYNCEGNEFSLFMLFGSNYMLNHCKSANSVTIYPFVHQWTNNLSYEDQIRPISIPDIDTTSPMTDGVKFCMSAGDFTQIYAKKRSYPVQQANGSRTDATDSRDEEQSSPSTRAQKTDVELSERYDCIITVFFIDTARNIFDYLDLIKRLLKPGGYWLNLGPLLYHHVVDASGDEDSPANAVAATIPLPHDELKRIIEKEYKFQFASETLNMRTSYAQNNRSMLKYNYDCVKFVCQKDLS